MRALTIAIASLLFIGCGDEPPGVDQSSSPTLIPEGSTTAESGTSGATGGGPTSTGGKAGPTVDAELDEVVYVIIHDFRNGGGMGFCTGALVSRDVVLTAGHCVDTDLMSDFEVIAPRAPNAPHVTASRVARFDGDYDDPSNPDIGLLKLDEPIVLAHYAQMTDVSARVDGGETLQAMAVVRSEEEPEAPLENANGLLVSSAIDLGYEHGFSTPMFSHGGDSGAGLFLVENGKRTHQLIAVARQPEPSRGIDHFTRIDPAITEWFDDASAGGDE